VLERRDGIKHRGRRGMRTEVAFVVMSRGRRHAMSEIRKLAAILVTDIVGY
jgi:hypothetical protein